MDRTSLDIAILILTLLFIRGIFVLRKGSNPPKKGKSPDPADEALQPTEEVVFVLSVVLLAVSIFIRYLNG